MSSPEAVVVSIAPSWRDRKPMPLLSSSSIDQADEGRHRAAEAVQAPDHQGVPRFCHEEAAARLIVR